MFRERFTGKKLVRNNGTIYLKHSTHPLETVLLTGIWSLLRNNHYPLIIEHSDWKHSDPETHKYNQNDSRSLEVRCLYQSCLGLHFSSPPAVHCLDWFHGKSSGHQVVGVVPPPADHQQTLNLPHHKDKTALYSVEDTQTLNYTGKKHRKTTVHSLTYWANKSQESWAHKWNLSNGNSISVNRYHLNVVAQTKITTGN